MKKVVLWRTVDCRLLFPGQKPNQIYIWSFTFTKLPCCNLEFNISLVRFVLVILRRYILVITFSLKKVFFFSRWRAWKWFQPGPCVFHAQRPGGFPAISRIFLFSALEAINEMSTDQLMKFRPFNNSVSETAHILDRFSFSLVLTSWGSVRGQQNHLFQDKYFTLYCHSITSRCCL